MNSIKNIFATAVVAFALSGCSTAHAAETTTKPLQGASFHAGSMHAAGYFLNETRTCKLVLTSADDLNYAPTRVEAAIEAGKFGAVPTCRRQIAGVRVPGSSPIDER